MANCMRQIVQKRANCFGLLIFSGTFSQLISRAGEARQLRSRESDLWLTMSGYFLRWSADGGVVQKTTFPTVAVEETEAARDKRRFRELTELVIATGDATRPQPYGNRSGGGGRGEKETPDYATTYYGPDLLPHTLRVSPLASGSCETRRVSLSPAPLTSVSSSK